MASSNDLRYGRCDVGPPPWVYEDAEPMCDVISVIMYDQIWGKDSLANVVHVDTSLAAVLWAYVEVLEPQYRDLIEQMRNDSDSDSARALIDLWLEAVTQEGVEVTFTLPGGGNPYPEGIEGTTRTIRAYSDEQGKSCPRVFTTTWYGEPIRE